MNFFKFAQIGIVTLAILQITILSGCDQYAALTNDPPKITTFTVPAEVAYGETIKLSVRVFDPEDDPLTYVWDVSGGTLLSDTGPEVQWTAPALPPEEIVAPRVVTIQVYVRDGGEEDTSKAASIIVFSKAYRVAQTLSGIYTLISKREHGDPIEESEVLRLTTTTFIRESRKVSEDSVPGPVQFVSGTYKLVEPFDARSGTIHWFTQGDSMLSIGTYTWDGKLLVFVLPAAATQSVYTRIGPDPGGVETDGPAIPDRGEVVPEPINTDPEPIEVVEADVDPEPKPDPIDVGNEPIEVVEADVDPEPKLVNPDGKPIEVTDATFATKVLNAKLPVVLEFEADWCPFCRQMIPVVDAVASENRNTFIVGRLDIDANRQTTEEYKVKGVPTYLVFREGTVAARFAGAMPKEVFKTRILEALK